MLPAPVIATLLETVVNSYLKLDIESQEKLAELADKVFQLELSDWQLTLYLLPQANSIRVKHDYEDNIDVSIRVVSVFSLLRLARGDLAAEQDIYIQGDMHSARRLQQVLKTLDIDWEEQLSRIVGDIPAHQLGNLVRKTSLWGQQTIDKLQHDISEYLLYEQQDLPPRRRVERFLSDVDVLRTDADRLAARIQRLQQHLYRQ